MRIDIVTGFPHLLTSPLGESMLKRARAGGYADLVIHDIREFATDKHKTIDDSPYGGGAGMILKPEPVFACIERLQSERQYDEIIYMTADGERFAQSTANELSLKENLILLCGHYKGIDDRIRQAPVTREISIGDYVLTGGELPALVVVDSVVRLIPGVLHDGESLLNDSFQADLLGSPYYTRPAEFRGMKVPEVLISGDHVEIARWREEHQLKRTHERRKDLIERHNDGD
jgi:tRNA (guanine37-N1)-methyltransferase